MWGDRRRTEAWADTSARYAAMSMTRPRRLFENALLPKPRLPDGGQVFVILQKIILGISTICLWLFFQVFLDFEQNFYSRTASEGDPDSGTDPGTAFKDLPDDWTCPECGAGKEDFKKVE